MNQVNKTLYIPLYGKALVSKKNILLRDLKAEFIWNKEQFELKGKSKSKYLAYYMAMRALVFDEWTRTKINNNPNAIVLHVGCGLDSRVERINALSQWYDLDFENVIEERKKYYQENTHYHMISGDITKTDWLKNIDKKKDIIVIMEGVSMYVTNDELKAFFTTLENNFNKIELLMDCYSIFAAKASKYKNPINDVGVTQVYGLDDPMSLNGNRIQFVQELEMTPEKYICELEGVERFIFDKLYAGNTSKKLYQLYEFRDLL